MSAALAPGVASEPQLLADLIADLVAAPAGTRPLHIPIGLGSEGLDHVNRVILEHEHEMLRLFGMGHFIAATPAEPLRLAA